MAQLLTTDSKSKTVRELIERQMPGLIRAVPRGIDPQRFARIALTTIHRSPDLLDCTPMSLIGCLMLAAQLGLDLDPQLGLAYLIPFRNRGVKEAQMVPGYQGLMELARRSGRISRFTARTVHEADDFDYAYGTSDFIHHKPARVDPGRLVAVYAIAHLTPPGAIDMRRNRGGVWEPGPANTEFDVMELADIEAVRARSRARDSGPWVTDYAAMARKTVIRRLYKILPRSVEMQRAVRADEEVDRGEQQDYGDVLSLTVVPDSDAPAASSLDRLTSRLPGATASDGEAREPGQEG